MVLAYTFGKEKYYEAKSTNDSIHLLIAQKLSNDSVNCKVFLANKSLSSSQRMMYLCYFTMFHSL